MEISRLLISSKQRVKKLNVQGVKMRRYCVMVVAWACVLGLVSCGVKPPKEAKARELVEAHFKEKGYEVECVSLGAYRLLGEGHWASEVAIKKKEADLSLLFEVEFKST